MPRNMPTKLEDYFPSRSEAGKAYPPPIWAQLLYKGLIRMAIWMDSDTGISGEDHEETLKNININTEL